jgi:hypothetical protein
LPIAQSFLPDKFAEFFTIVPDQPPGSVHLSDDSPVEDFYLPTVTTCIDFDKLYKASTGRDPTLDRGRWQVLSARELFRFLCVDYPGSEREVFARCLPKLKDPTNEPRDASGAEYLRGSLQSMAKRHFESALCRTVDGVIMREDLHLRGELEAVLQLLVSLFRAGYLRHPVPDDPSIPCHMLLFACSDTDAVAMKKLLGADVLLMNSHDVDEIGRTLSARQDAGSNAVIVATHIAESSLTLANVGYVVHLGQRALKEYDASLGAEHLIHRWLSHASVKQRRGRTGRTNPGFCLHLFHPQMYSVPWEVPVNGTAHLTLSNQQCARATVLLNEHGTPLKLSGITAYDAPALRRTSISTVLLFLAQCRHLIPAVDFPLHPLRDMIRLLLSCIDPPAMAECRTACLELCELGALDVAAGSPQLSETTLLAEFHQLLCLPLGELMLQLPLPPRFSFQVSMALCLESDAVCQVICV